MTETTENARRADSKPQPPPAPAAVRLADVQAQFKALRDALFDFLFLVDQAGRILDYHTPHPEQLYVPPERFLGQRVRDLLPAAAADIIHLALGEALEKGSSRGHVYSLPFPAGPRHYELSFVRLDEPEPAGQRLMLIARDITEHKRAEEALRKSEAKYRLLFENLQDGFVAVGLDRRIIETNPVFQAITGYSAEELRTMTSPDLIAPAWHPLLDKARNGQILVRGYSDLFEMGIRRKDGSILMTEGRGALLQDEHGQPAGIWAIFRDITERKRAEEALRESEARFRELYERMQDGLVLTDMTGHLMSCNPAFAAMLGYREEELRGRHFQEITPPGWEAVDAEGMRQVLQQGFGTLVEKSYFRKDGTTVPVEAIGSLMRDAQGAPTGILVVARDITARKRAEEQLRESEAKYRRLFENLRNAFVSTDMAGHVLESNEEFLRMTGYSAEELRRMTYPEYTPAQWQEFEANVVMEQLRQRGYSEVYRKEYRCKDGTLVPVELRVIQIRDEAGQPAGMWAIVRDITMRVRIEQALQQAARELEQRVQERTADLEASRAALARSEEQFRQMAESIGEVFYLLDAQTRAVLYASPIFKPIWGQPDWREQPTFEDWISALHPDDRERTVREFEQGLETGQFIPQQYRILRPDGEVRWISDRAWPIRAAQGRMIRVAGVIRDITEERQLEAKILQAAEIERERIGRDLHDSLGQSLTAIGYLTAALREELQRRKDPAVAEVRKLGQLIEKTAAEAHGLARGLLLADVKRGGLVAALQELAFRIQEQFGRTCQYAGPTRIPGLDLEVASQLYRMAQEAATNAVKHGKHTKIEIRLARGTAGLQLSVQDTGPGLPSRPTRADGVGLDIMRYRAGLIGAVFWIDSAKGKGTTVNCLVPRAKSSGRKKQ